MSIKNKKDADGNSCDKRKFKKVKSKACLEKVGPINKLVTKARKILLCKIPPIFYPRYNPQIEDLDCSDLDDSPCPDKQGQEYGTDFKNMDQMTESAMSDSCTDSSQFARNADRTVPEGFGASPNCAQAATVVLGAVLSDALTPGNMSDPSSSATAKILADQIKTIGI